MTRSVVAVAAGAMLVLTGCGSDDEGDGGDGGQVENQAKASADTPIPKATPEPTVEAPEDVTKAISSAVLTVDEVAHDVEEQDREDNLNSVTNDICAKEWPSNSERAAREQALYWAGGDVGELVVSHEVVMYNEGQGEAALQEIRDAIGECGQWKHRQGEITGISEAEVPQGAVDDSFAWSATDEREAGESTYAYLAVYQLHGDMLSAVYLWAPSADEGIAVAEEIVPVAAERLQEAMAG